MMIRYLRCDFVMIKSKIDYKRIIRLEEDNYRRSYPYFTRELENILLFQKLYRKCEYYKNCRNDFLGRIIYKFINYKFEKLSFKYCFHIPINVIDEGFCIVHIGPIYINENAKIGKNFRIHPMTTIGKSIGRNLKSPTIGNGVWVGPGARIYGDISIGDNVVIGTNSVVGRDVPSNVTVGGVPSKIINNKGYRDYFEKNRSA